MARACKDIEPPTSLSAPPAASASVNFSVDQQWLQESFEVWLRGTTAPPAPRRAPARLTAYEVTRVGLATVRESEKHRRWPTEVLEGFLAAEIITDALPQRAGLGGRGALARRFNLLRMFAEAGTPFAGTLRR